MDNRDKPAGAPLYAALRLGALKLLLAQNDIRALEGAADIDTEAPPAGAVGWIEFGNGRWPAFCLSDDLAPLRVGLKTRRVCALLNNDDKLLGLLCDDLEILDRAALNLHPLPWAMRMPDTPVQALVTFREGFGCVSSAAALAAFLAASAGRLA